MQEDRDAQQAYWRSATGSVELSEALLKSLNKGRTIQVKKEQQSESDAFKGMMASVGCGLLIAVTLLFLIAVGAIQLLEIRGGGDMAKVLLSKTPHVLLFVLVAFLLLQLLRFVIPDQHDDSAAPD